VQFFAGNHCAGAFEQKSEQTKGFALKLDRPALRPHLAALQICLESPKTNDSGCLGLFASVHVR
jgi:hypothetical protein